MAESLKPSALAKQIHSIEFGHKISDKTATGFGTWFTDYNTWDTYHLVPSSRPVVNPPDAKTNYVDMPGIDGPLDMSTALTGTMLYKNREGSWEFVVANDYQSWDAIYHNLKNQLHGKFFEVRLLDEPSYYYKGRLFVNEWKSEQNWSKVTLDYNLQPYKFELNSGNEPWLWDPFNFENGVIRSYGYDESPLYVFDTLELDIPASERIQSLIIHVVSGTGLTVRIGHGASTYPLNSGANDMTEYLIQRMAPTADITQAFLGSKLTNLIFYGSGSVYVEYQGGWL